MLDAPVLLNEPGRLVIDTKLTVASPDSVVKSVGRVLEVLELLRAERRPMTGTEIGRALGYPKSSTNAILKSLVSLGYLSLDRNSLAYFPTLRLTHLGDWIPAEVLGSGEALNLLDELHIATSETVTLSMQNDLSMQFVRVITGTYPISLQVSEGYMGPLFGSGVGSALLSAKPDNEVRALVDRANARIHRKRDRIDPDVLLDELRTIREQGYAAAYDRLIPDSGAIAMALPQSLSGVQLVVAVAGLNERIHRNEKRILRVMRVAVNRHFPTARRA